MLVHVAAFGIEIFQLGAKINRRMQCHYYYHYVSIYYWLFVADFLVKCIRTQRSVIETQYINRCNTIMTWPQTG